LQVAQFMSDHALNNPGGCFYHHCATISILPGGAGGAGGGGGGAGGSGTGGGGDGGASSSSGGAGGADETPDPSTDTGCGCRMDASETPPVVHWAPLVALGVLLYRRRRR
jgi:MYXO-CTERM domain-containing protein